VLLLLKLQHIYEMELFPKNSEELTHPQVYEPVDICPFPLENILLP
jgi:hypothetical protein